MLSGQFVSDVLQGVLARWTSLTYSRAMLTQDELAKRLAAFNVEDLSREAKVSTKTIYRLRNKLTAPNFSTLERLLEAMERMSEKVAA